MPGCSKLHRIGKVPHENKVARIGNILTCCTTRTSLRHIRYMPHSGNVASWHVARILMPHLRSGRSTNRPSHAASASTLRLFPVLSQVTGNDGPDSTYNMPVPDIANRGGRFGGAGRTRDGGRVATARTASSISANRVAVLSERVARCRIAHAGDVDPIPGGGFAKAMFLYVRYLCCTRVDSQGW